LSEAPAETPARPGYRIHHEPCPRRVRVVFNGVEVADSRRAILQRETRLAPVYYLPREDVRMDLLARTDYRTHCPFKGNASYWTLSVGDQSVENAVWSYEDPLPEAEPVRGYLAFTRSRMDAWLEDEADVSIEPVTDPHAHDNPLVDWLLRDAWEATSIAELLARLARQLWAAGVPLLRVNLFMRTLHPQVMGAIHLWSRERDEVEVIELEHQRAAEARFLESPFVPIFEGRGGIRRRLEGPDAVLDFPILRDLAALGATDYVAMPLTFSDGRIHALTLASDAAGGFDVTSLGHLHELMPLLSRLVEVHALRHTARTLLDTYLGPRREAASWRA
jgi:adenylate cyclase